MKREMKKLLAVPVLLLALLFTAPVSGAGIEEYTDAINRSPADMKYKFYLLRGMAYRKQREINAAIKDFSVSIKMRASHDGYLRRGEMYFEKGAYAIAEEDFTAAIAINPSLEAHRLRGVTYLVLGKLDQAIAEGTEMISLAPNASESYNIRMEAYAQVGKQQLAREDARRALSLDRKNAVASELLVRYPEKIELTTGISRYRPKGDINRYRVWANSKGFAFTLKPEEEEAERP
jgi:tetratricopeptide (TPR) repeat protein